MDIMLGRQQNSRFGSQENVCLVCFALGVRSAAATRCETHRALEHLESPHAHGLKI